MKKLTKSTKIAIIFLIYVTAMSVYLLPRNSEISLTEKIVTVALSYVVVALLWLVLWKKEQLRKRKEEELLQEQQKKEQDDPSVEEK